jgi:hypothetical protein
VLHVYDVALLTTFCLFDSNTDDKEDVFSRRVDDEVEKVQEISLIYSILNNSNHCIYKLYNALLKCKCTHSSTSAVQTRQHC